MKKEKRHVGRPTNKEVERRKTLSIVKVSCLISVITIIVSLISNINTKRLVGATDSKYINSNFIYYSQKRSPWKDIVFCGRDGKDGKHSKATIKSYGCGTTSMSMVLANLVGSQYNPKNTMQEAVVDKHCGYNISGTAYSFFKYSASKHNLKYYELGTSKSEQEKALSILRAGGLIIVHVKNDGSNTFTRGTGHYIVIYAVDKNNKVYIADPNERVGLKEPFDLSTVMSSLKDNWCGFTKNTVNANITTTPKKTTVKPPSKKIVVKKDSTNCYSFTSNYNGWSMHIYYYAVKGVNGRVAKKYNKINKGTAKICLSKVYGNKKGYYKIFVKQGSGGKNLYRPDSTWKDFESDGWVYKYFYYDGKGVTAATKKTTATTKKTTANIATGNRIVVGKVDSANCFKIGSAKAGWKMYIYYRKNASANWGNPIKRFNNLQAKTYNCCLLKNSSDYRTKGKGYYRVFIKQASGSRDSFRPDSSWKNFSADNWIYKDYYFK